jgi:hypothetical protein
VGLDCRRISRFTELYPLTKGQLPLSIDYFPIGFDHGDRSSRWHIENGSGERARREFQSMAANAWRTLSGPELPHAWMRWCDVLLAEATSDEVHPTNVSGAGYPERLKVYETFDLPDACRISARVSRQLSRGSAVWQWPGDDVASIERAVPAQTPLAAEFLLLDTEERRRKAVKDTLAHVSKERDLDPPLKDDTEFWKASPYTHRGTFELWIKTGGTKSADDEFRKVLAMDSQTFHRRLLSWPERRTRPEQKNFDDPTPPRTIRHHPTTSNRFGSDIAHATIAACRMNPSF